MLWVDTNIVSLLFLQEKSKTVANPSLGLLVYPVLQSADILLYKLVWKDTLYLRNKNEKQFIIAE